MRSASSDLHKAGAQISHDPAVMVVRPAGNGPGNLNEGNVSS